MPISTSEPQSQLFQADQLKSWLKNRTKSEGFDKVGVTEPDAAKDLQAHLDTFLVTNFHGDMAWLAANAERRGNPLVLWPDVRSIIMLGLNYGPQTNPLDALKNRSNSAISVYAQGADYHDVIKGKLKAIAGEFARRSGGEVKVFVDTAPVMEKPLAQAAGIGWQGKHTNLVVRDLGSWLFLGAIFTNVALPPDEPERDHCGGCHRCLDICPTKAFPTPYRLDARRCISYLTIEHKSQIDVEFRTAIGNRIYGCDDCLAVCPWNKFAKAAQELRLAPKESAKNPPLAELLSLDDISFRARFAGTPVKRVGRDRFIRNVLVAAGNSGDDGLLSFTTGLLADASPLVRGMAVWATMQLMKGDSAKVRDLKRRHYQQEVDPKVRQEWEEAGV